MNTQADTEAAEWLIQLMELAAESKKAEIQALQPELLKWATSAPENLAALIDAFAFYQALGECETELVGALEAIVDDQGAIVSFGPGGVK